MRLETRAAAIPGSDEQKEKEKIWHVYLDVWDCGGTLEDVPEKDRDPRIWDIVSSCALTFLEMVWEGILDGREELLAAGVDFTLAAEITDYYAFREYGAPDPDTPRKL